MVLMFRDKKWDWAELSKSVCEDEKLPGLPWAKEAKGRRSYRPGKERFPGIYV